jgi:hypothetical protein
MLLIRPNRKDRGRVAAFLAVLLLHLCAGLLILPGSNLHVPIPHPEEGVTLTFLPASAPRPASVLRHSQVPLSPLSTKKQEAPFAAGPNPAEARRPEEPNNSITLPFIDWNAEAEAEVRRKGASEETERQRRNLAGPSASQLEWWQHNAPLVRGHHELGDTEYAAGGEVITWLNDKCFYTTNGITTFGMPQTSKVCKDPPKPETHLFKDMRKQLDEYQRGGSTP